jgi:putative MATE family efflux protein
MSIPIQAKRLFKIALPTIGENYLQNLLGVVDSFFIAKMGLLAINAVGVTNIYSMTFTGVFTAISTALSVFLSRAYGAKDNARSHGALFHGLFISFLIGLSFSLLSIFLTGSLLHLVGATGQLESTAFPYFKIVLGLSPLIALHNAFASSFRATGKTGIPLRIGLEMNVIHVILDYVLIFGIGTFHGYSLLGAGIAMIFARLYALIRLWLISLKYEALSLKTKNIRLSRSLSLSMLKFAIPTSLERLSVRLGQVLYFGLIVRMGTEVYATHNIAGSLTVFASTIGGGFATAVTACIGQAIGEGKLEAIKVYRFWGYILSSLSMTLVTFLLVVTTPWIGQLFTHNKTVLSLLAVILFIDTFSQPFLAAVLIDTAVIQTGGNSTYPMIVTMIGIWGLRTLGVYVFAWVLGYGLPAVWISIGADNALRAALFFWYRKKRVLVRQLA